MKSLYSTPRSSRSRDVGRFIVDLRRWPYSPRRKASDMTLLHHHRRTVPKDTARITFWSSGLPCWAEVERSGLRPTGDLEPARWTCARCGAVLSDFNVASEHIGRPCNKTRPRRTADE